MALVTHGTDGALVGEIAAGSAAALERLYDLHGKTVYAMARRILGQTEDAEEVVQDVFAQVWREAGRYQGDRASVAGWLVMLTRGRAIDRLRSRRARPDQDLGADQEIAFTVPDRGVGPEQMALSADEAGRVAQALAGLPDDQRALIELAYFEGWTQSELADKTGTPLGTVKTRMRSAMQSLRAALTAGGAAPC